MNSASASASASFRTLTLRHDGVLDPDSSPRHIEKTRHYLRDFLASLARTSTAMELYETMLSLHPNRVNPGSLWAAAKAAKPSQAQASSAW